MHVIKCSYKCSKTVFICGVCQKQARNTALVQNIFAILKLCRCIVLSNSEYHLGLQII